VNPFILSSSLWLRKRSPFLSYTSHSFHCKRMILLSALSFPASSSSVHSKELAHVYLDETLTGKGLRVPNAGDGQHIACTRANRPGRIGKPGTDPPSNYIYFDVENRFLPERPCSLYVEVDYFSERLGSFSIQYDSSRSPYTQGDTELMLPEKRWETRCFLIRDALFESRENHGSDFRFHAVGGVPFGAVRVSTTPPMSFTSRASAKERIRNSMKINHCPKEMEYTFGNDATESTAPLFRALGVSSIESYVTWETVEGQAEGVWDWSRWDEQVRILQENDLKWVPFLIAGPAYATPGWFREDDEKHLGCVCLEHDKESKIQSIWNPRLKPYISRFLVAFKDRYLETGVIESLLLGITGDFGEAIYSVSGGGWTFNIPGEYHNHGGFWCGDDLAFQDYKAKMLEKYKDLSSINRAWGTKYANYEQIDFPARGEKEIRDWLRHAMDKTPQERRRWLDFMSWYRDSMTQYADWWLGETRRIFPDTPIYLCTGGDAHPFHGSQFADQSKVAARHKAGIRITNEASNYPWNFAITRWVGAACSHYGTYFGYEPAGQENETGIKARIYNVTASGAKQLHDYNPNVISSQERMDTQREHFQYLFKATPRVSVALWYPDQSLMLRWGGFLEKAAELRDVVDFDYVDETLLRDGALQRYRILLILHGHVMEKKDLKTISSWIKQGGLLISLHSVEMETVEGDKKPFQRFFGKVGEKKKLGSGDTLLLPGELKEGSPFFDELVEALRTEEIPLPGFRRDGVFGTCLEDGRLFFLNTNDLPSEQEVYLPGRETFKVTVPEATIHLWEG